MAFFNRKQQVSSREVGESLVELIAKSEKLLLENSMGRIVADVSEDKVMFNALCLAIFAVDLAIWTALAKHEAIKAVRDSFFVCVDERMRNLEPPGIEPLNDRLEIYTDVFKDQSDVGGYNGIGKAFAELCGLPDDWKLRLDAIILFKSFNNAACEFLTQTCLEKYEIVK